jgi:hypothetical protein
MTISSTTVKNSYSGDGSTSAFSYTFKIFANSDLQVIIRSSTGAETVKTITTHYNVSGAGDANGGSVTFTSGNIPASGETVVIRRAVPQTQSIDYIANDPFPAESHEEGLDRSMMTIQQMQEELDRSFKVSRTNTISSSEFTDNASTRASKTLGFDSSGDLTTVADFLPAGGDSALFKYSTTTTDADPGSGIVRFNHATFSSVTELYIDDEDFNGTDVSSWVQSFDDVSGNDTNRGRIRIQNAGTLTTYITFKVTGAVTDATGYTKVTVSHIASSGTLSNNDKVFISFVASGEDGAIPGYFYKFDTGTSDTDPGAGEIAFNNGTYASATEIYIDDADANGVTVSTDILTWDDSTSTIRGYLHIVDINDSTTYARFKITGASTDASGYVKLAVGHLASNNTFSAADELSVHFTRNGDTGDTGATGSTGSTGSTGATGASGTNSQLSMTFNNSTSDADPGAGKIAFNNGTLSSVSVLFIDDADDGGADITTFVQSFDDVSNTTARGIITITKEGTPATFATYKVSGAITDASGYTKVPVSHLASNGSFSNTDGVGVHFSYSGADGSGDVTTSGTQTLTNKTLTTPKIAEIDSLSSGNITLDAEADIILDADGANVTIKDDGTSILDIANNSSDVEMTVSTADKNFLIKGTDGSSAITALDIDMALAGKATFNAAANVTQQALTSSSNAVAWDATAKPNAVHITTENTTFSAPTNNVEGAFICLEINYNGSHTIAFNTIFEFAASTAPTFTSTDGKTDILVFRYNGSVWQEVGRTLNLSES